MTTDPLCPQCGARNPPGRRECWQCGWAHPVIPDDVNLASYGSNICGAKTTPQECPHCRKNIFYFWCPCGSRVFFDKLGRPWPKHPCLTRPDGITTSFSFVQKPVSLPDDLYEEIGRIKSVKRGLNIRTFVARSPVEFADTLLADVIQQMTGGRLIDGRGKVVPEAGFDRIEFEYGDDTAYLALPENSVFKEGNLVIVKARRSTIGELGLYRVDSIDHLINSLLSAKIG